MARAAKTSSAGSREPPPGAARILERKREPMLGLDHFRRRIEPQLLGIAMEVGDRHEQVERLIIGEQGIALRPLRHRLERVEDQVGERGAAERRREPGRAHEIGELRLDLGAVLGIDGLVDRARAGGERPGDRHRARLGEPAHRAAAGGEQRIDIRGVQPELGQRIDRLAGGDGVAEEDGVDAAGAGAGEDVDEDAQIHVRVGGDGAEQARIDVVAAGVGDRRWNGPPGWLWRAARSPW